jgi:Leucine-rich repeat (LRR) protein
MADGASTSSPALPPNPNPNPFNLPPELLAQGQALMGSDAAPVAGDDEGSGSGSGSEAGEHPLAKLVEELDLDDDCLDDPIDELEEIDLSDKDLTEIPEIVFTLSALTGLFLEGNKLKAVSAEISKLGKCTDPDLILRPIRTNSFRL